jgi:formyltetrahydrofolate hydrolase
MIGEQPEHLVREQRLVVMVSGNGSNLQALFDACADGTINGRVVAVVSNKAEVFALQPACPPFTLVCVWVKTGKTMMPDSPIWSPDSIPTSSCWLAGYEF